MKLVVELKEKSLIDKFLDVDGFIINLEGLSCYYDELCPMEELEEVIKKIHQNNQKVYLNARKIFHENELDNLDQLLDRLLELEIDYYFYGDVTFYEMACKKHFTDKLIYQVNTYMTNHLDIMVMLKENHSVVVSTEVSFDELKDITNKVKEPLYIHSFGYYPIFHSRRELITNYQKYRQIEVDTSSNYDIVEELRESHYPIEQNENGMAVYLDGAYCLAEEIKELGLDNYYVITSKFIETNDFEKIVDIYNKEEFDKLPTIDIIYTKGLLYEKSKLLKKEGGASCE
ncbi:MAG: U32 family peptidase [Bacilli bacterium]|nr:U32 family peptidase [Bacilli bacterium]